MAELTPMMRQYHDLKNKYQDAVLFFRLGDFYEMFGEDAKRAAKILDIALTSRNKGGGEKIPMAGVPYHSAASYIEKLIKKGIKVAICEQLEDPSESSGIVERDVIRVVTPGTVIENEILSENENNYLAAVFKYGDYYGFSYTDISTGEFYLTEFSAEKTNKLKDEINRISPRELLLDEQTASSKLINELHNQYNFTLNILGQKKFERLYQGLLDHFKLKSLEGFGCEEMKAAVYAAGQVLSYLSETQKRTINQITNLKAYHLEDYMVLDSASRRNLELSSTIRDNQRSGSLLSILDQTVTSMGAREIKKWINQPLVQKNEITKRHDALAEIIDNYMILEKLRAELSEIYDLERIMSKITYQSANARDLVALRNSLAKLPAVKKLMAELQSDLLSEMQADFDLLEDIYNLIDNSIKNEPPTTITEGGIIKDGYDSKLDELRSLVSSGKDWISALQKEEREKTGINTLKVGFNKVFGYYLEVTNSHTDKVPERYERKQTLSNSERYIIPELKEKESEVLGAEEKINDLEYKLFVEIRDEIAAEVERINKTAAVIAKIDVLLSFSYLAIENNYNRPEINNGAEIKIKDGRHPVVEKMFEEQFVPNDCYLNQSDQRFIIITGPNMSGKSTYMRQVALIVLMAQIGSYVPAAEAIIGLTDRIFTRVGASDDLTTGQSTFMVEMNEVANIVNNSTEKSLIILDEVGRGTSTYDGVSIAWSVSEYLNNPERIGARTLFATHYHELTRLEDEYQGIKNYNVLVEEDSDGVHFLHRIVPGRANDSYGIEVARLAGLPEEIIISAQKILERLEENNKMPVRKLEKTIADDKHQQLPLFNTEKSPILKKIDEQDILEMTPMDAMNFLYNLKKDLKEKEN
ncbi:DNA mismatch repair protein MutS [Halanaerobium congolense]|uniref:DNA mismatch repair protein MutS n=1 Tax=Halanaerobium congolense TaxID=54121 RepID=A0A4R7ELV8_9FIRM|nr:DNA mismatch repair protein MutS [Halanaerobium congolense]KXS49708.1 MAG: DNA mismatch repair protein MutS [Halanaerobium sp. T82-1]OEG63636.1 MAG: DNA mismatch repair protein MutS [Halanaerobium sp. MDAL1]TDS33756.1 DNA mismatch repair protein MutS [Halanaerobium congolense]SDK39145.1 DNA mismatch repair protein MutS [Halanaerobium congolense]SDM03957.1 DNA mismatch repair protein MutS [Halanaerobium congolense]